MSRNGERFEPDDILRPAGQVHFASRNHCCDTAVEGRLDPADLILARRPIAKHRMHMAINQAGCHARIVRVDDCFSVRDVAVFFFTDCNDQPIVDHNRIGRQNRLV